MSLLELPFLDTWQVQTTPLIYMKKYILQQRIEISWTHYENSENLTETVRETSFGTALQNSVKEFNF